MPLSDADLWGSGAPQPAPAGNAPAAGLSDADVWGSPSGAPAAPQGGILANLGAGIQEAATSTSEMLRDAFINPRAIADRAWNMANQALGSKTTQQAPGAATVGEALQAVQTATLKAAGVAPQDVPAKTPAERVARMVGAGIAGGLLPGGEEATVGGILRNMAIGSAAGGGSGLASEAAPAALKPAAAVVGGLLTGGATGAGLAGVEAGANAARAAVEPVAAAVSPEAAAAQAGRTLVQRSTNPEEAQAAMAAAPATTTWRAPAAEGEEAQPRSVIVAGGPRIDAEGRTVVPVTSTVDGAHAYAPVAELEHQQTAAAIAGSNPTTFQLTGDLGLGALEREQRTANPELFRQREAEQAAARNTQVQDIAVDGSPDALATGVRANLARLEQDTQTSVDQAVAAAHAKAATLGGEQMPEDYGQQIREAIGDAETAARARESGLWKAVDPDGDLTGNVAETIKAAKDLTAAIPVTAKPMAGEEAGIFQAAQEMPKLAPVQDLIALRSRVSTEMRNELIANGRSPTYARLATLRGAIQDNLASTITDQITDDQHAVAAGTLEPDQAAASRIQEWIDDYRARQGEAAATGAGPAAQPPTGGTVAAGAGVQTPRGSGGAAGGESVPPAAPDSRAAAGPTFDEAAAERLKTATAATAQRARTFGMNPVSPVTAKAGAHDLFKLPEGKVPEKFFHPGPTGFTDMQALFKATGESKALPLITDYAAASLRRAAMRPDGTLDPVKYHQWAAKHVDALRALPEDVRQRFSTIADASRTATAAAAARALTLKGFQDGAIGKVLGVQDHDSVVRLIGTVLNGRTAARDTADLMKVARDAGPAAVQGLKRAVVEHILTRLMSNTEIAASGVTGLKADAFQTFMRKNQAALGNVFTARELDNLNAVAADIQRAKRTETAIKLPAQSNTAQDLTALARRPRASGLVGKSVLDAIGGAGGFAVHGPIGMAAGAVGAHALQALREQGVQRVDDLLTQAMLHPEVARALMAKAPNGAAPEAMGAKLAAALRRAAISTGAAVEVGGQHVAP